MAPARCPVCGVQHATCGHWDTTPVDRVTDKIGAPTMPDPNGEPEPTQVYDAETRSGIPYRVRLTETDAKRLGVIGDSDQRVADATGEQAEPAAQPAGTADSDADAKARATSSTSNKARSSSAK